MGFYALVGFPLNFLASLAMALWGPMGPGTPLHALFGVPVPPGPGPEAAGFARTMALVMVLLTPLWMALGLGISGLVNHAGLWALRGLGRERGLEVTFRATLYGWACVNLVAWPSQFWTLLPPLPAAIMLGAVLLLAFGGWCYLGVLLARAHGTDPWRGVLGIFLPWILCGCCVGLMAALAGVMAATAMRG
jgi:hypothetical protein